MKTIYHPTFGFSRQVPKGDAAAWKAHGWRYTPPNAPKAQLADQPSDEAVTEPDEG